MLVALTTSESTQIAVAGFTALTAVAAFASVFRVERDRWRRAIPDFHVELIFDGVNNETRLTIANLGGPAREARVMGTYMDFGWFTPTPPTTYWRSGETRTYRVSIPVIPGGEDRTIVEARDLRKKQLVLTTTGGASYRWPLRKAKKLSLKAEWERLFSGHPTPLDVPHTPMKVELIERFL